MHRDRNLEQIVTFLRDSIRLCLLNLYANLSQAKREANGLSLYMVSKTLGKLEHNIVGAVS